MDSEGVSDTLNWNGSPFDTKQRGGGVMPMDKKIMIQYADLQEEIKDLRKRIEKTKYQIAQLEKQGIVSDTVSGSRQDGTIGPIKITGFPDRDYHKRKNTLNRQLMLLQEKEDELLELTNEVELYIESIEDSRIRRIFRYRYLDDMSWEKVARTMGGGNTADGCRSAHDRYIGIKK